MSDIILAFPLFAIIICFFGAVICSFSKKKVAFIVSLFVCIVGAILSGFVLAYCLINDKSFIYTMGHFGPNEDEIRICNEIRFGPLEGFLALFFSIILCLCIIGGKIFQDRDIDSKKQNLYYVMMCLILVSNMALIYTNDIFTGFVFIEISTLASCGCLMVKSKGPTILSTIRYMIFNLIGSGLFLIGIVTLYSLTGYLSIENIANAVVKMDEIKIPAIVSFSLVVIGLSIKAGLFPFHFWMPDAYGYATPTSSSILSGIVTKGYILLLIKCIYRMFTYEVLSSIGLTTILFVLGVLGMIIGSINAINQKSIDRMVAFSSAAQIGYIFMGIGMGENIALVAALFHILTHAITKPLIFLASGHLSSTCNDAKKFKNIRGVGRVDKISGIAYSVGAFSMVGIPFFAGFMTKYNFITSALNPSVPLWMTIAAIAALITSTLLNAFYFIRTMFVIYYPLKDDDMLRGKKIKYNPLYVLGVGGLACLNIFLGLGSALIIEILQKGATLFV